MAGDRDLYPPHQGKSLLPVLVIGGGILALIVGTSPGVRHFLKHGFLPDR